MARRWLGRLLKALAAVALIGGLIYWLKFAPVPVQSHRLDQGEIISEVLGTGTLEAHVKGTISPKISGRIAEILVDQGARVKAGELLVRLDDEELRQQVAIAEANLSAAQAAIERFQADKERALAVANQARKQHARVQSLIERKAASQEDLDRAIEALNVAGSGLSHAEAAFSEGQKERVAAEKTLEYHRARLADTTVRAPFDGLIVRRHRDPGDVIVPGSAALSLVSTDELWISAWVDETEMAQLAPDQPARVIFRSEPERAYSGRVARLGKEADRETREFLVDVRVLQLPSNWAVGQRAEVYIETQRKPDATRLPAAFVVWRGDVPGVFVHDAGKAVWRPLKLGLRGKEFVEVVEGVEAGETVVFPADPRIFLTDGRRITPSPPTPLPQGERGEK